MLIVPLLCSSPVPELGVYQHHPLQVLNFFYGFFLSLSYYLSNVVRKLFLPLFCILSHNSMFLMFILFTFLHTSIPHLGDFRFLIPCSSAAYAVQRLLGWGHSFGGCVGGKGDDISREQLSIHVCKLYKILHRICYCFMFFYISS